MPLIRRLPKRGFNNAAFHKRYAVVNVSDLNAFKAGTVVDEQLLRESNLVRGHFAGIKILGEGELKHGLKVQVAKISTAAREKIEKAGGTVTLGDARSFAAVRTFRPEELQKFCGTYRPGTPEFVWSAFLVVWFVLLTSIVVASLKASLPIVVFSAFLAASGLITQEKPEQ